jgi:hypothetical protein
MSDFEKNLKKAADRYTEPAAGEPAPDCSRDLEDRVGALLAREERKERCFMKRRTKWTAVIAAAAVLLVMTVAVVAAPVIRNYLNSRILQEGGAERLNEVPDGWIGIYTVEDLDAIRDDLWSSYILMEDLTFDPADFEAGGRFEGGWTPIGTDEEPFYGIFDGNGHVIRGLIITDARLTREDLNPGRENGRFVGKYAGLFGYCKLSGRFAEDGMTPILTGYIKNLGLEDGSVTAGYGPDDVGDRLFVGPVAGYSEYVIGCYVKNYTVDVQVTAPMIAREINIGISPEESAEYGVPATPYYRVIANTTDYALAVGGVAGGAYLVDACYSDTALTVTADPADVPYRYIGGVCGITSACVTSYFNGTTDTGTLGDCSVCFVRENDVPHFLTEGAFDEIASRIEATADRGEFDMHKFMSFYTKKYSETSPFTEEYLDGIVSPYFFAAKDLIAADIEDCVYVLDPETKPIEYTELSDLISLAFPDGSFEEYCRENNIKYGIYYVYDMRKCGEWDKDAFDPALWTNNEDGLPVLRIFE